jgi:predicted TPR repeat methyltransferase
MLVCQFRARTTAICTRQLSIKESPITVNALGTASKDAEGAKQLYDDWADSYDASLISWEYPAPSRVAETITGSKFGGVGLESTVVDLGCGTGLSGEVGALISCASSHFRSRQPGIA